jgi:hypothetical protein
MGFSREKEMLTQVPDIWVISLFGAIAFSLPSANTTRPIFHAGF